MEFRETDWIADLLGCCSDCNTCCLGFWCCPCAACKTSEEMGHAKCLPLLDMCTPSVMASLCGLPLCVAPAVLSLRVAIRTKYRIKGTLCKDIMVSCCCVCCAYCQMAHEIKHRKKNPNTVVINVQQQPTSTSYVMQ